jgi:hypothetical protein
MIVQRAKKLKEVERELLETEAQEDEQARRKQLTEVTKTVFHIYFRLLKQAPHSKLLAAALHGLAKSVLSYHFVCFIISLLMSPLLRNKPSLWITHNENGP